MLSSRVGAYRFTNRRKNLLMTSSRYSVVRMPKVAVVQPASLFKGWIQMMCIAALTGCGGGSEGSIGNGEPQTMLAGASMAIGGRIETARELLQTLRWDVMPLDGSTETLQLQNASCDAARKLDRISPAPANTGTSTLTSGSTWDCTLLVTSTANVTTANRYTLFLTGVDTAGRHITQTQELRVLPNPSLVTSTQGQRPLTVSIAGAQVGRPGQSLSLGAAAQWAAGVAKNETSPQAEFEWSLGASTPAGTYLLSPSNASTQLVLPTSLTQPVVIPVKVSATANGWVASREVSVLVDPFSPLAPSVNPPVQVCKSGSVSIVQAEDIDISNPNLFFKWSVVEGPNVVLGGDNTFYAGFVAPVVSTPTSLRLRFATGYAPITETNPGTYFVDALVMLLPGDSTESENCNDAFFVPKMK